MDLNSWPKPVPFDPERADTLSALDAVLSSLQGKGTAILLIIGQEADRSGWGRRTAMALADAWPRRNQPTVLADVSFDAPTLHANTDRENDEGIVDVLLFGASIGRVARPIAGHSFAFAPAGAFIPDPAALMREQAWDRLIAECVTRGSRLLCYVAAGTNGLSSLASRVEQAVFIGSGEDAGRAILLLPEELRILAVLTPAPPPPPASSEADEFEGAQGAGGMPEEGDLPDQSREALIADLRARQRSTGGLTPPADEPATEPEEAAPGESEAEEGESPAGEWWMDLDQEAAPEGPEEAGEAAPGRTGPPARDRRRSTLRVILLVVASIVIIAIVWYLLSGRPGSARTGMVEGPGIAPQALATPSLAAPYSVAVEAQRGLAAAEDRLAELRSTVPDIGFYIAPASTDTVPYYRIMAGPVADSAAALAVLDELLERGVKGARSARDVEYTPLAFLLDDFQTREAAAQIAAELRQRGIPSYVLAVPEPAGLHFRLYAGAYAGAAEAGSMRRLLHDAGLNDTLVQRTGRSTS